MIDFIAYLGEMILWNIAVWTYYPPWMLGNKFQRWWYHKNGSLQGWLLGRLEINIRRYEKEAANENSI